MEGSASANSTRRFSDRVENYIKYRPGYPKEMMTFLIRQGVVSPTDVVVDIGSGTGISTRLFLENGNVVYAIEPNDAMREAGENELSKYHNFKSINATAENTSLPSESIDLIVAGQAFHWFDAAKTKLEWQRVLKPRGRVLLIWNERLEDATPFLKEYELLLRKYGTDYEKVNHKNISADIIAEFFNPNDYKKANFENSQHFDFEGLKGRLLSSSYTPAPSNPNFLPMLKSLEIIFNKYNKNGMVDFKYDTVVYFGEMK